MTRKEALSTGGASRGSPDSFGKATKQLWLDDAGNSGQGQDYWREFGLNRNPFSTAPDPKFSYTNRELRDLYNLFLQSVEENGGFFVLTGQAGVGKTALLRQLAQELSVSGWLAISNYEAGLSFRDLASALCQTLGLPERECDDYGQLTILQEAIRERQRSHRGVVLLIDDAHHLGADVLAGLRQLLDDPDGRPGTLRVVLAGQPELRCRLDLPALSSVATRLVLHREVPPFSAGDIGCLVLLRLRRAGYRGAGLFSEAALDAVADEAHGVPGRAVRLCAAALREASVMDRGMVTEDLVKRAASQAVRSVSAQSRSSDRQTVVISHRRLAAGILVGLGVFSATAIAIAMGTPDGMRWPFFGQTVGSWVSTRALLSAYANSGVKQSSEVTSDSRSVLSGDGPGRIHLIYQVPGPETEYPGTQVSAGSTADAGGDAPARLAGRDQLVDQLQAPFPADLSLRPLQPIDHGSSVAGAPPPTEGREPVGDSGGMRGTPSEWGGEAAAIDVGAEPPSSVTAASAGPVDDEVDNEKEAVDYNSPPFGPIDGEIAAAQGSGSTRSPDQPEPPEGLAPADAPGTTTQLTAEDVVGAVPQSQSNIAEPAGTAIPELALAPAAQRDPEARSGDRPRPSIDEDSSDRLDTGGTSPGGAAIVPSPVAAIAAPELHPRPAAPAPLPNEIEMIGVLKKRGEEKLASGDLSAARRFYERAAAAGDAKAATTVGKTYDPIFLKRMAVRGAPAQPEKAAEWYRKGLAAGDAEAEARLDRLRAFIGR